MVSGLFEMKRDNIPPHLKHYLVYIRVDGMVILKNWSELNCIRIETSAQVL
jgi:hypothetical protein